MTTRKPPKIALTPRDAKKLAECEATIDRGLGAFVEIGDALGRIRDEGLYRATYTTFGDYCRERWDMDRSYAHRVIDAAKIAAEMLPIGNVPNEAVARRLAGLGSDPAGQKALWQATIDTFGSKPTARQVSKTWKLAQPAINLQDREEKRKMVEEDGQKKHEAYEAEMAAGVDEAAEARAREANPGRRKPTPQHNAFRHPNTPAGDAGRKAELLMLKAIDRVGTPEGVTFFEKAAKIAKEHHLKVEIGVAEL